MHLIQAIIHQDSTTTNERTREKVIPQEASIPITMAKENSSISSADSDTQDQLQNEIHSTSSSLSDENPNDHCSVDDSDVEAVALATKTADENYLPSQSLMSSSSPYPLIRSVDGISLKRYNPSPSRFSAKDVIVPLRGELNIPIHVVTSGSIVDYSVQSKDFDIGFGIEAEREEGVTIVKVS